jgi:hypothetical protein
MSCRRRLMASLSSELSKDVFTSGNDGQKLRNRVGERAVAKEVAKAMERYTVETEGKPLQSLSDIRPLYFLPNDPLAEEVLIPGFKAATKVDCMVGFFSSEVLASLAPGLASYIANSESSFRLIISPYLRSPRHQFIYTSADASRLCRNDRSPAILTRRLARVQHVFCLYPAYLLVELQFLRHSRLDSANM